MVPSCLVINDSEYVSADKVTWQSNSTASFNVALWITLVLTKNVYNDIPNTNICSYMSESGAISTGAMGMKPPMKVMLTYIYKCRQALFNCRAYMCCIMHAILKLSDFGQKFVLSIWWRIDSNSLVLQSLLL